jgi:hypothetical protein
VILPVQQARAAAQGRITLAFIPIGRLRTVKRGKGRPPYESQPWTPQTGRTEPLQARVARKMPTIGHIVIDAHQETTLAWVLEQTDDSLKTARAAGFKTRAGFADHWLCQYQRDWPPTVEEICGKCNGEAVLPDGDICPDCTLGTIDAPADIDDQDVLTEFAPHANSCVHIVHFHPVADDRPRFLSMASRPRGDDAGYTIGADSLDAGAVVPAETQQGFVLDARENRRKAASIASEQERNELARLISSLERQSADVRVARELRHMRARLKRINALLADAA